MQRRWSHLFLAPSRQHKSSARVVATNRQSGVSDEGDAKGRGKCKSSAPLLKYGC